MANGLVLVGVATMVGSAASYLLSMFAARLMSVAAYGGLGAMLSVSIIGGTVALGAQAVGARRIAVAGHDAHHVRSAIGTLGYRSALAILVVGALLAWPLGLLFAVPGLAVFLTAAGIAASLPGFSALGVLQGEERHHRYGLSYAAIGCLRAGGGIVALFIAPDVVSVCAGILVGNVLGTVAAVWISGLPRPERRVRVRLAKEVVETTTSLVGLYALANTDVLLARVFLDPHASGEYALGSLIAKIAFFLPAAVITVFFPKMASGSMRHAFLVAVGLSAAIGAVATAACALLAGPLVWVIGGDKYSDFSSLAWVFALEGSLFAIAQVVLYAGFSSRARTMGVLTWAALAVQFAVVGFWLHGSVGQIVGATCAIAAVLVVVGIGVELRRGRGSAEGAGSGALTSGTAG